jgi:glycosyltransferase involved in cell wall biosynthesis
MALPTSCDAVTGSPPRTPLVTVAVPSFNQGAYLDQALHSIFAQDLALEVMLADGGSTDGTPAVIARWKHRLTWWRSGPDGGQAQAVNEALARGSAPFVCWLNSDDLFVPGGLALLVDALRRAREAPAAYGRCWILRPDGTRLLRYRTEPFSPSRLARRCFIAQPATLIRRAAWEGVGGLDPELQMAMDYDLWWRLFRRDGPLQYVQRDIAASRAHLDTKTITRPRDHYREAKMIVRRHHGSLPAIWHFKQPLSVAWRLAAARWRQGS